MSVASTSDELWSEQRAQGERIAALEALIGRLESKSTSSSQELLSRQEHLDSCIDSVRDKVDAQGEHMQNMQTQLNGLQEQGSAMLRAQGVFDGRLDTLAEVMLGISTGQHAISERLRQVEIRILSRNGAITFGLLLLAEAARRWL